MRRKSKTDRLSCRPKAKNYQRPTVPRPTCRTVASLPLRSRMFFRLSASSWKPDMKVPCFVTGCRVSFSGRRLKWGSPARFTVGVQNQVEHFAGETRERNFTLEARYALANWNKLPLNPAISAEY